MTELISEHLDYLALKGRCASSIAYRRRALARLAADLAPVPLAEATRTDLARWRAGLAALSDASVIAYVAQARGFYGWLVQAGHRRDNPAADLPVPRSPSYRPRPISERDLFAAVLGATGRTRAWLVLAGWCGMRCVEIAKLRRNCVRDTDTRPGIRIAPGATKGTGRGRFIPLDRGGFVLTELDAYGLPGSGWVFPRLDGAAGHVEPHLVSHLMSRYLHSLGFADTGHSMRHRFATQLLAASGGNIRVVQETLGHANLATTAIYTAVENSQAAAAVGKIPAPKIRSMAAAIIIALVLATGAHLTPGHRGRRPDWDWRADRIVYLRISGR